MQYYYFSEENEDLLYELPYFFLKITMSTTIFNKMFGRPTLGSPNTVTLENIDEEDLYYIKRLKSFEQGLMHVPYPNVLSAMIEGGDYKLLDDGSIRVS